MSESKSSSASERAQAAVLGGLVGDASSTGVHWIYGDDRVRQVVGNYPEFVEVSAKNYRPDGDYFAHKHKRAGDFTHYGEHALIVLRSLAENKGQFNLAHYSALFKTHFGAGGEYVGYVDHAMRTTLYNMSTRESPGTVLPVSSFKGGAHVGAISNETAQMLSYKMQPIIREHQTNTAELHAKLSAFARTVQDSDIVVEYALASADAFIALTKAPAGADDHQSNALVKLIPLVAAKTLNPAHYAGSSSEFRATLESFIRVTQNNDTAVAYLLAAAFILELAIKGYSPKEAITATAVRLGLAEDPSVQALLKDSAPAAKVETIGKTEYQAGDSWAGFPAEVAKNVARALQLAADGDDTVAVTGTFGRACYLRMTLPSCIHALLRASSYEDGVRRALLGGGDNSSRAAFVGAVLGASLGFGSGGIPAEWVAKTRHASSVFNLLKEVQSL